MKWVFQLDYYDPIRYLAMISLRGLARYLTSAQHSFSYTLDSALA
jgi:hypothetical protein